MRERPLESGVTTGPVTLPAGTVNLARDRRTDQSVAKDPRLERASSRRPSGLLTVDGDLPGLDPGRHRRHDLGRQRGAVVADRPRRELSRQLRPALAGAGSAAPTIHPTTSWSSRPRSGSRPRRRVHLAPSRACSCSSSSATSAHRPRSSSAIGRDSYGCPKSPGRVGSTSPRSRSGAIRRSRRGGEGCPSSVPFSARRRLYSACNGEASHDGAAGRLRTAGRCVRHASPSVRCHGRRYPPRRRPTWRCCCVRPVRLGRSLFLAVVAFGLTTGLSKSTDWLIFIVAWTVGLPAATVVGLALTVCLTAAPVRLLAPAAERRPRHGAATVSARPAIVARVPRRRSTSWGC